MTSNHAPNSGGCFFLIYDSTAFVSNCLFDKNTVQFYMAGAIHVGNSSKLYVLSSTFTNNSAGPDGGSAIAAESSSNINVDDTTFSYNDKSSICIKLSSSARIENSGIDNTRSDMGGAITVALNSTLYMMNVTLAGNEVQSSGGALTVQMRSKVEMKYCTFLNNKASALQASHDKTSFVDIVIMVSCNPIYCLI